MDALRTLGGLLLCLGLAACGDSSAEESKNKPPGCDPVSPEAHAKNQVVFDGLSPTCASCHSTGARPFFASLESFESIIVYDPAWVVPGDPDASEMIRLLEGKGSGAFAAMPIGTQSFADLEASGKTQIGIAAIRTWASELDAAIANRNANPDRYGATRLSASQFARSLDKVLGLDPSDTCDPASPSCAENNLPVTHPDELPRDDVWSNSELRYDRYRTLGGGSAVEQFSSSEEMATGYALNFRQVTQAHCRIAVSKSPNPVLLPDGLLYADSGDPAAVKAVLGHWFKTFHGRVASAEELEELISRIFVPQEQASDPQTAFVAACSYLAGHPHFLFY